jgi:hypothetical protein
VVRCWSETKKTKGFTVEELNEAERLERRKKDFAHALDGMDRAVQWVRTNQDVLSGFTIHLYPDREFGVELNLSFIDGEHLEAAKKLFAGRSVKKTTRDEEETFELVDEELQIRFRWLVWKFRYEPKVIEESVTF